MSGYVFIGDIHGDFNFWFSVMEYAEKQDLNTIQVGDFGMGFNELLDDYIIKFSSADLISDYRKQHRVIRGNHDNPDRIRMMKNFIQDGHVETISGTKIMYIGGAFSIDQSHRRIGVDWWPDEECSIVEMNHMMGVYEKEKPDVMVTHDCPGFLVPLMFGLTRIPSRTTQFFDSLYEIHKPKLWVFGHYHQNKINSYDATTFICVGEKQIFTIDLSIVK